MKKISRLAALLVLSASFTAPLFAIAADGCTSPGARCTVSGTSSSGYCVANPGDTSGYLYCMSTGLETSPATTRGGGINISVIQPYADSIKNIINDVLMPVFMAIAFIVFLWGIFKYFIWGAENEQEKADGRKFAMWGIIGLAVIFSVWGLVNLVRATIALPNNNAPNPPQL
jgi:hypothetical protein